MKMNIVLPLICGLLLNSFLVLAQTTNTGPYIPNHGAVWKVENRTIPLKSNYDYKIVFDITSTSNDPSVKNRYIDSAARFFNMLGQNGIPKENIHVALIIHSSASKDVMNNEWYQAKYSTNNPNINLIAELIDADADVIFCGQSSFTRKMPKENLIEGVDLSLSALTSLVEYQSDGYQLIKY